MHSMQDIHSIKYGTYIQMYFKKRADSIRIQFQLTQMSYIMKLISSPVKPSQLIFPSLTLIKSSNTSILVHTLSDIMCQTFILDLIDNLPSLSNVPL